MSGYRAQSFVLNYVLTVKMSNGWKEEFCDIPWLADEEIQRFLLPCYSTSVPGHRQLWRQTSITVKSRNKLARGLEKASKAACIKSQTKQEYKCQQTMSFLRKSIIYRKPWEKHAGRHTKEGKKGCTWLLGCFLIGFILGLLLYWCLTHQLPSIADLQEKNITWKHFL